MVEDGDVSCLDFVKEASSAILQEKDDAILRIILLLADYVCFTCSPVEYRDNILCP